MRRRSKKQPLPTRRQALAMLGVGAGVVVDPVRLLLRGLVDGIIADAAAAGAPGRVRKYVGYCLAGGPSRYHFDQLLTAPGGAAPSVAAMAYNRLSASGQPEYATVPAAPGSNVQLPWLWSSEIPTSDGRTVPMRRLAQNMLCVRGINMRSDGHDLNRGLQVRPSSTAPSLTGLAADSGSAPVPAVGASPSVPWNRFRSASGVGCKVVPTLDGGTNPLLSILSPFDGSSDVGKLPAGFLSRRAAMERAMSEALASLGAYSRSDAPGAAALDEARHRAEKVLATGIGDAAGAFPALLQKYSSLVSRAGDLVGLPVPQLTDRPIKPGSYSQKQTHFWLEAYSINNADARTAVVPGMSTINGMASGFALTEYLLTRSLSSSILIGSSNFLNLAVSLAPWNAGDPALSSGAFSAGFDWHYVGQVSSFILSTFLYRSFAACLYELKRTLEANGMWEDVVVHLFGEFSRIPRADASGADHGWMSSLMTAFSGAIQAPMVLGNIAAASPYVMGNRLQSIYSVAFGEAAPLRLDGIQQTANIGHGSSTLAALLGVRSPTPNNASFVQANGSAVVPAVDPPQNV